MRASFDYSQLIDCAEGRLFGNANARLPAPPMLMIDRVVNIDDDGGAHGLGSIHAELDIKPDVVPLVMKENAIVALGLARTGT